MKLEWMLKDNRKMSDILDQAVGHYEKYKKTHDPGERFAYLVEMYTLTERMGLATHLLEKMAYKIVAKSIFEVMKKSSEEDNGFQDYSPKRLGSLAYLIDQIERPGRDLDVSGCIEKLAEFKSGVR